MPFPELEDDDLASKIAKDCKDPTHDERWCPTCEARIDAIDDYREALRARLKQRPKPPSTGIGSTKYDW